MTMSLWPRFLAHLIHVGLHIAQITGECMLLMPCKLSSAGCAIKVTVLPAILGSIRLSSSSYLK